MGRRYQVVLYIYIKLTATCFLHPLFVANPLPQICGISHHWSALITPWPPHDPRLSDVLAKTLTALQAAGRRHFFTLPNCWELFGADFLVEAGTARAMRLGNQK